MQLTKTTIYKLFMRPLGKNVIVKQDEVVTKTTGGIMVNVMKLKQQKLDRGTVLYIGKACEQVKPGDRVTFGKYAGINVEVNGEELILIVEKELDTVIV